MIKVGHDWNLELSHIYMARMANHGLATVGILNEPVRETCYGGTAVNQGRLLYKLRSVQNTGTCYPGQGLTNPAEVWVTCPGILHRS